MVNYTCKLSQSSDIVLEFRCRISSVRIYTDEKRI